MFPWVDLDHLNCISTNMPVSGSPFLQHFLTRRFVPRVYKVPFGISNKNYYSSLKGWIEKRKFSNIGRMLARTRRFPMVSLYLFYLYQICSQHQISVRRRFRESWKAIRSTHPKFPITADPRDVLPVPCGSPIPLTWKGEPTKGDWFRDIAIRWMFDCFPPRSLRDRFYRGRLSEVNAAANVWTRGFFPFLAASSRRTKPNEQSEEKPLRRVIALPVTRFPTFRPPSRTLPTSKELLFVADFVRVNGMRVFDRLFIFPKICQKCKDYSYISFDAFQTWIKRRCRWYLLEKRFRQSRQ